MPPRNKNSMSLEEKRKAKRERERKRRAIIKADPLKYEEARRKEKERRQRRKDQKKILLVNELTPRQQRIQRKEWRERASKCRNMKKLADRALRAIRDITPSTDCEMESRCVSPSIVGRETPILHRLRSDIPSPRTPIVQSSGDESSVSRQKIEGSKRAKKNRILMLRDLEKQKTMIMEQRRKIDALQKKLKRLTAIKQREIPIEARKKQKQLRDDWAKRKQAITTFLEDDENSMISPGIKDTITRNKTKKQKRYLCDSLEKLHKKYNCHMPRSLRVSYASFCRLRPFWILKAKLTDRDTCMCVTHENFRMIVERLRSLKILRSQDFISYIVCNTNEYVCMSRKCIRCINKYPEFNNFEDDEITYNQWITQNEERSIKGQTKSIKRTVKARLVTSKKQLVEKFVEILPSFLLHKYNISNQHKALTHIRENLTEGEVLVRVDFSENFSCKYYSEAQSVHFGASRQQVSIHTGVFYYLSIISGKPENISFCTVSLNLRHDASAVYGHLKKALLHLMKDQRIETLHIASDGPSSQYKNKNNFYLFSQHLVQVLNVSQATWHFSESSHGKGPADGVGAAVKEAANRYVRNGNDIPDYDTFVQIVKENCNVLVYEISDSEIKEGDDLLSSSGPRKQLVGTKKMHQVTWIQNEPFMISMRDLTCIHCHIAADCVHFPTSKQRVVQIPHENPIIEPSNLSADHNSDTLIETSNLSADHHSDSLKEGVWVLCKFEGAKSQTVLYIGQIISVDKNKEEPFLIKFTRKKYQNIINEHLVFVWKEPDDLTYLSKESIVCSLSEPTPSRRGELIFNGLRFDYPIM